MEMITSAQMIDAQSAMHWGLVNQVCGLDELIDTAHKLASKICRNSPNAIAAAIKSVNAGFTEDGYQTEIEEFGNCFVTDDFKEGTSAFLEKRKPKF